MVVSTNGFHVTVLQTVTHVTVFTVWACHHLPLGKCWTQDFAEAGSYRQGPDSPIISMANGAPGLKIGYMVDQSLSYNLPQSPNHDYYVGTGENRRIKLPLQAGHKPKTPLTPISCQKGATAISPYMFLQQNRKLAYNDIQPEGRLISPFRRYSHV